MNERDNKDQVIEKLDLIINILRVAFKEQIDAARKASASDRVSSAILDIASGGWIEAKELRSAAAAQTGQSERTVLRRIASLVEQRAIEQSGSGARISYRTRQTF